MDHEVLDCPRMIAKVEKKNMRQENYETGQETKDTIEPQKESDVTHNFGHHDDVLMMVYSGSSLKLSPEKSYLHLFPEITFLRKVRRLPIHLPARIYDSRRLP
jgi:hypothetical protein